MKNDMIRLSDTHTQTAAKNGADFEQNNWCTVGTPFREEIRSRTLKNSPKLFGSAGIADWNTPTMWTHVPLANTGCTISGFEPRAVPLKLGAWVRDMIMNSKKS
ncbi:hypothetical protein Aduo_013065 [Ancylostoma duodenale]